MLSALPCLLKTTQSKPCSALAKKAETLFLNLSDLIERRGIERIAFHTLTFAENLKSRKAAQKRFNSYATNFLRKQVTDYVAAVERQQRGAIHYHVIVAFPYDVRSGFNFEAAKLASLCHKRDDREGQRAAMSLVIASANPALRAWWNTQREAAKRYGFGRCETLPVLSNSAAVSRYVGGYVGSEWTSRSKMDRGLRTIRYGLEHRAAGIRWSWSGGAGETWRRGCRVLSAVLQTDEFTEALGNRWAYYWGTDIARFGRHWEKCLAFTNLHLSDHEDWEDRIQFLCGMSETIEHHEKLSKAAEQIGSALPLDNNNQQP